jgi:hypothetical protein
MSALPFDALADHEIGRQVVLARLAGAVAADPGPAPFVAGTTSGYDAVPEGGVRAPPSPPHAHSNEQAAETTVAALEDSPLSRYIDRRATIGA